MSRYIFDPPAPVSAAIAGDEARFPVRRIFCVGRNYAAHRREMGGDDREPPFFFGKPADALVQPGQDVPYPSVSTDFHHEIELVAALKSGGVEVPVDRALDLVFGYAVGVDLTRRDLQAQHKAKGQPWESAKAFDASAPMSPIRPWSGAAPQGRIYLNVNGAARQDAVVADMLWNMAEIIAEASKLWRLEAGDLIFTGTPEGVGPLVRGDKVDCGIAEVGELSFRIV